MSATTTNPLGLTDKQIENIARVSDAMGHAVLIGLAHSLKNPELSDAEFFERGKEHALSAVRATLSDERKGRMPEGVAIALCLTKGEAYSVCASAFDTICWTMADIYTKENEENGTKL